MTYNANSAEAALGQEGQEAWEAWLTKAGWCYHAIGSIDAPRAPMAQGAATIVLPDLAAFRNGRTVYLECKAKTIPVLWERNGEPAARHCINLRSYREYQKIEETSGVDVVIGFYERNEPATLERNARLLYFVRDLTPARLLCTWLRGAKWERGIPGHERRYGEAQVFVERAALSEPGALFGVAPAMQLRLY